MQTIRQDQANLDSMLQKGGADAATTGSLLIENPGSSPQHVEGP
jgi:hypothetical protein